MSKELKKERWLKAKTLLAIKKTSAKELHDEVYNPQQVIEENKVKGNKKGKK